MAKQNKRGGGQETALQELYRHSQSLLRLSRALEQAENYNDVIAAARNEVQQTLGYPTIWVYLFSNDKKYAYPLAADGTASETILHDDKAAKLTIAGDAMLEEITRSRDIVVVEDARTDPRTDKEMVAHLGNRTIINIPILFLDRHLGAMGTGTFGDEGIRAPSSTERDYLTSLASSLAVTLDRIHLQYERKQAEESLRSQRDQLSNIYATSPVGITMVNRNGRIVNANPQAEKVLGLEKKAILQLQYNTPAWKITDLDGSPFPDDQLPFTRVKTTGQSVKDVQHAIQWPDGRRVFLSINAAPLFDKAGQFDGMIASIEDITERKRAETVVHESEQALNEAQRIAHLGSWYMDLATKEVYWSEELYKMYGLDSTQPPPLYSDSAKLFTPESWERLNSAITQAVEHGTPYEIELQLESKAGAHKWMLARGELVLDAQGKPIRVRGVALDITERKEFEKRLLESEQQFRSLAENSPDNIIRYDRQCRLIYYNPAMVKTIPLIPDKFLGKTPVEVGFGSPELNAEYEAHIRRVMETGESSDMELVIPNVDGQPRNHLVRFAPEHNERGEVTGVIAIGRDITDLKQAEERILQSEQRLRLHAEQSPLGFLVWDKNFCATDWNAACEKIFGYTREEALGRHARDLILPEEISDLVDGIFQDLISQTGGTHSINENLTKDGRTIIVEWFNTTLVDKDGEPVGVASICRDITELKLAEKERQLHAEFLTNMDRVNRAIQGADDLETMMRDVLDEVLDILDCDRAFLLYPCDPSADAWSIPMERTRPEYPGAGVIGKDIPMDNEVATTLRLLLSRPGALEFTAESENRPPKDVSERFGIKSFMSVAVYPKVGKPWQFGIHQCSHDRIWTEDEQKLLEEIGRRLADGLTGLLVMRDLRESEARYQRLFDTANEGIWIQDENFVTTFVNEHMANMLGYTAAELMTHKVTEFMPEEDAADHAQRMDERSKNISAVYERRMLHKNGGIVWMLISATPIFENSRFHGSFAMLTDITDRKEAEQKLATSEQLFRTLIEHSPDYIARYDREMRRIYINPALQQQFAVPTKHTIGTPPTVDSPLNDPERYMARIKQAIDTGTEASEEFTYHKPDGEICWSSSRFIPEFDFEGNVATVMVISTDITERKRAEEELALSEEKFSKAFYASPNLMAITRPEDGLIVDINESFCRFFGYTREECVGHNTAELQMWVDPKQRDNVVNKLKETGAALYEPVELRTKSGEIRSVIDSLTFIHIDTQKYLLSVAMDITERIKAEEILRDHKQHLEEIVEQRTEELRLARDAAEAASKAKSVFLANMSHELRTPLNAILGFSQMMQQDQALSSGQHNTLDIINKSGEHLLKLINDVLEIAKIEAGKLQLENSTFDLHVLVREVTDMMQLRAEQKGLKLELDQSSEFPRYIKGDEARLRQILVNLVSNAVKFTDSGQVIIRLAVKDNTRHHLVIEIEDTGPGISQEDQQHLFKPFVQLPEGRMHIGTGLGLSIVRQFVHLMKGHISVESTPGKGSLFRIELPLQEAEETDIIQLNDEHLGEITGLAPGQPIYRILVTEDQQDNQLLLSRLMTDIGMEVRTANNGEECIKVFKEWKPDLIWMDWRMPVMNGDEATRRIRKLKGGKKVKVVAVTASAFKEQEPELINAGVDDYVRKPFHFNEIYESLSRQLGVEFTYSADRDTSHKVIEPLNPQRLSALSPELRIALKQALESLDREQILVAIESISLTDKSLGRTLSHIVDEFDYPNILSALATVAKESPQ